jgi:dTDP-4-amino-4,6-dideoxygalactose transaminase
MPYQIGFVPGHYYLQKSELNQLKIMAEDAEDLDKIAAYEKRFAGLVGNGEAVSFAAGRMAFFVMLKALNIKNGDEVILPAFTCSVMVNAIYRAGGVPVFTDIDNDNFGSCAGSIMRHITSRTRLIVVQHSFGIPCGVDEITALGRKRGIFIVEDCAITLDSKLDGIKVGDWADAAFFSTDHSKPINTLAGGMFYSRDRALSAKVRMIASSSDNISPLQKKRMYQQIVFERKNNTPDRYPRSFFHNFPERIGIKKSAFFDRDYFKDIPRSAPYPYPSRMPSFLANLGMIELDRWGMESQKRKNILASYIDILTKAGHTDLISAAYLDKRREIVPLRFALECDDRDRAFGAMKDINTAGTWFKEPIICCPSGSESMGYIRGSCPIAERTCKNIINWPCVIDEKWVPALMESFKGFSNKL